MGASVSNAAKDFGILTKIGEGTLTIPTTSTKIFTATEDCLFAFVASGKSYFSLNRDDTINLYDFCYIYGKDWYGVVNGNSPNVAEIIKRDGHWLGQYTSPVFSIRLKAGDYIYGRADSSSAQNSKYFVFK